MFKSTINTLRNIVRDVSSLSRIITVASQLILAGYFTYLCIIRTGLLPVNIAIVVVSLAYLVIYFATYGKKAKAIRGIRSTALRAIRAVEIFGKAITLGISIYGVYLSTAANPVTIILATLSIIAWIVQLVTEILRFYIELKVEELVESFKEDMRPITDAVVAVRGTVEGVKENVRDFAHGAANTMKNLFSQKPKESNAAGRIAEDEKTPEPAGK